VCEEIEVNEMRCAALMCGMHALATTEIADLPRDVDALIAIILEQRRQYSAVLESLRQQLSKLKQITFGSRSERLSGQALLFGSSLPVPPPKDQPAVTTQVAAHERKRRLGRPALPADLPRVRQDYDSYVSDGARQDAEGRWRHYPRAAYFEFSTTRESISQSTRPAF
jgi:hypothetical protein